METTTSVLSLGRGSFFYSIFSAASDNNGRASWPSLPQLTGAVFQAAEIQWERKTEANVMLFQSGDKGCVKHGPDKLKSQMNDRCKIRLSPEGVNAWLTNCFIMLLVLELEEVEECIGRITREFDGVEDDHLLEL